MSYYTRERQEIGDAIDRAQRLFGISILQGLRYDLTEGYAADVGATPGVLEAIDDLIDDIPPLT